MCSIPSTHSSTRGVALAGMVAKQARAEKLRFLHRTLVEAETDWKAAQAWELEHADWAAENNVDLFPILAPIGDRYIAADIAVQQFLTQG